MRLVPALAAAMLAAAAAFPKVECSAPGARKVALEAPAPVVHVPGPNVLANAAFERAEKHAKRPEAWSLEGSVLRKQDEQGNGVLKLAGESQAPSPKATQTVSIPRPAPAFVTIGGLVKGKDIRPADGDSLGYAAVTLDFLDAEGAEIDASERIGDWEGSFGWRPWAGHGRVPAGARSLTVTLILDEGLGEVLFDELALFWGLPDDRDLPNWVIDGGLEYASPLSAWRVGKHQKVRFPGRSGRAALQAEAGPTGESRTAQRLVFGEAARGRQAEVSFSYELVNVLASGPGGGARAEVVFLDPDGARVGASSFGPWTGSSAWANFAGALTLPARAAQAELAFLMQGASGAARFDDVKLTIASGGAILERSLESATDTSGWRAFEPSAGKLQGPLDSSALLDAPAGRHGFLTVRQDGHFYFEDGTRTRFFGVNLQPPAALPDRRDAERLAERLAQHGFNLVRLHHLDAPWAKPNLFDPGLDHTQRLSSDSLGRLDYFLARLKERGIYVYLDLLVSRKFRRGDAVAEYRRLERGAKQAAQFNARLIELQKQYASDLLNHVNPHTGTRWAEEPALVLTEIINESSLARAEKMPPMPETYREELRRLWAEVHPGADPEGVWRLAEPEVSAFYAGLQRRYFRQMRDHLRSLGLRIPIAGSNLAFDGWDLETNAELDFIDRHAYWDPPRGGYGDLVKFHNAMMTREIEPRDAANEPKRVNPIARLGRLRVAGKPFVVGEWNVDWPNEYRVAGPLLMAAYASFQDWDAILQFNYEGDLAPREIRGNFDTSTKPELFLQFPAAARLFHEGHVSAARQARQVPMLGGGEIPPWLPFLVRVERLRGAPPFQNLARPRALESDSSELAWDPEEGLVRIETARTCAAVGRFPDRAQAFKNVSFEVSNPFAAVCLTSLDGRDVASSAHLLLTAVARSENTGTVYNPERTLLRSSGRAPILLEPVRGEATLPAAGRPGGRVFALDAVGRRREEVRVRWREGSIVIPLGAAPVLEVVFGGSA